MREKFHIHKSFTKSIAYAAFPKEIYMTQQYKIRDKIFFISFTLRESIMLFNMKLNDRK